MFGNARGISARRVHDHDAAVSRGVQIDVVHAHAGAPDDAHARRVAQQFVGHARRAANDQPVGIGQFRDQRFRRRLRHLPAKIGEKFHTPGTDFVSDNNFHRLKAYWPYRALSNSVAGTRCPHVL